MARKIGIILLVFVAFYMGAHYWMRWRNTVTDDVTKKSRLVECDPNEVRAIQISNRAGGMETLYSFTREDTPREGLNSSAQLSFSEWRYLSPLKGEADASALVRFASMFCDLYDPVPVQADQFNLNDTPVERITYTLAGKANEGEHTIFFGRLSEDRMNVVKYVSPRGNERVVKIQPKIYQLASMGPENFLNTRVMRMTADNVMVATVFEGQKEKFTLERESDGWRVLAAGKVLGSGSDESMKYVNRLMTLRAIKVDSEALSPTACEDSSARMRVKVLGVGGREETVYFQYGKAGTLAVCNTARDALFTVHRDFVRYLETPVKDLLAGGN